MDALTNDIQARADLSVMITIDHELGKMIGSVTCWMWEHRYSLNRTVPE